MLHDLVHVISIQFLTHFHFCANAEFAHLHFHAESKPLLNTKPVRTVTVPTGFSIQVTNTGKDTHKNNCEDSLPENRLAERVLEAGLLQVIPERILTIQNPRCLAEFAAALKD